MTQNNQKITFELKHGYYAIIETGDDKFLKSDIPAETFEKAVVFSYEIADTIEEAKVVHVGNYDIERKMKAGS